VRRALADAGRRAVEVDWLIVAAPVAPAAEACRRFARRALGPHGLNVPVRGLAFGSHAADSLAGAAARSLDKDPAEGWRLAVCVGLGPDGRSVALCLDPAPVRAPGRPSDRQRPRDEADDGAPDEQRDRPGPT
jgi:hypothetical protein